MVCGLLLARAGVAVTVLEKHPDFLRDFRGDTIHPSTLRVMDELGMVDEFLTLPHQKVTKVGISTAESELVFADFSRLPGKFKYVAFMPQWELLNFLATKAEKFPGFRLVRSTEATGLLVEDDLVTGVRISGPEGQGQLSARLVIAADGRNSVLRESAGLEVVDDKAPLDVLWFRVSKEATAHLPFVSIRNGFLLVCVDRGAYWQIAYGIPVDAERTVQSRGLKALENDIALVDEGLARRFAQEVNDWDDVRLLKVRVDHLPRWYRPGLLCIGDSAHAMSPAGGVGINLAVQDAVAAARTVAPDLLAGRTPSTSRLAGIQRRRAWPARVIQLVQVRILAGLYPGTTGRPPRIPLGARLIAAAPPLQGLTARVIGLGLRSEHVDTQKLWRPQSKSPSPMKPPGLTPGGTA
jgi:2-polyprenyl-6-methoxyphenol hydroxylase-like FAD-dependent oxidoreductase